MSAQRSLDYIQMQGLTFPTLRSFIDTTRDLLKEEEQYEVDLFTNMTANKTIQQIEAEGCGLSNMVVLGSKKGFYGKTILTLSKTYYSEKNPLPLPEQCKMQVGDNVALFRNNTMVVQGVIYKRAGGKLKVSTRDELDEENDFEGMKCNVVLKWNEVTFRRYYAVLNDLEKSDSLLLKELFQTQIHPAHKRRAIEYNNKSLNEEQIEAVKGGIVDIVHLLHGPPGTGKTTTVCQLIVEAVKNGHKVLACAPSNIAVDNIVEGLFERVKCVRVGNPARIIESVIQRSLDYLVASNTNLWKNEVKRLNAARKKLIRATDRGEKKALYYQIKNIRTEITSMQQQTIQEILNECDVICCTNVGAADRVFRRYLPKRQFDLVLIDECGQSLQVSCWIPLLKGRRCFLAGDHKQLPPTIQGNADSLLSYTLFSRAMEELKGVSSTMLCTQYRMNQAIMGWSNKMFYEGRLCAHESVQEHQLRHLYNNVDQSESVLILVDTSGCGMGESGEQSESKYNVGEADIALSIYRKLQGYGVDSKHVAILTPYSKQVAYIKNLFAERNVVSPDISTVDGIQGREKQCIIISLVRSNKGREIGFLKDWRRINVAVTRARRMLIIIGNSECVRSDANMATLIDWMQTNGHTSSAEEFRGKATVRFGEGVCDKIEAYESNCKINSGGTLNKQAVAAKKKVQTKLQPMQHSDKEQEEMMEHYRKVFGNIDRDITVNNATAFQRKIIHTVSEELGLCHETSEDKKFIKVWKKLTDEQLKQRLKQMETQQTTKNMETGKTKQNKKKNHQGSSRQIRKETSPIFGEEMLHLAGQVPEESDGQEKQNALKVQAVEKKGIEKEEEKKSSDVCEVPKKAKKQKKKKKKGKQVTIQTEQDLDAIFLQFEQSQPKKDECYSCKKKIASVTTVVCKYCGLNYCRQHVLAEEHGCGDAAKAEARANNRDMDKYIKQGAEKIQLKIKQQEEQRRRKVKGKDDRGK